MGDATQKDAVTINGFSILPKLNTERDISPLAGVILNVLRARWNVNSLTPQLCTQKHRHRKVTHIAGTNFDSEEALQLIHLTAEVMKDLPTLQPATHIFLPRSRTEKQGEHASFLQVGSI